MKRITSLSIILFFIGFIFVPSILWLVKADAEFSSFEKRRLAEFPVPVSSWESISSFPKRMENYYGDHFGLRDQLIALHSWIYIKVFGKSPDTAVTIGQDGWLFYNADHLLQDFMGLLKVDVIQFESWHRILRDRQEWLHDNGVQYLMSIVPSKMTIYPEFLPERIQKQAGRPLMPEFLSYLRSKGFTGMIDLLSPLLKAKQEQQVYFRTDTHWNTDGAYVAYLTLMDRIRIWYPGITVVENGQRESRQVTFTGDLGVMLHLSSLFRESAKDVTIVNSCRKAVPVVRYDLVPSGAHRLNNSKYFPQENGCPENTWTALVLHDSYGRYMRPYFDESFKTVIYSQYVGFSDLKEFIKKARPSVVVDQRASRFFSRMLQYDAEIESYILQKHFSESRDDLFFLRQTGVKDTFVSSNDVILSQGDDGLILEVTGDDPFLELEFDHHSKADCFMVQVSLTSPSATTMQFFYTTSEQDRYAPDMVVSKAIRKGRNDFLFRLPHPNTHGKLRFDPGFNSGTYVLHSLHIKGERFRI